MRLGVPPAPPRPASRDGGPFESLTIDPPGCEWAQRIQARAPSQSPVSDPARERASRFRSQLGLPIDRPVIMTGHQAEFWHAGILAKYFAADAAAKAVGAEAAWVVVDQTEPRANTVVRYPARERARLVERRWGVGAARPEPSGIDFVDAGLARIEGAWNGAGRDADFVRRLTATLGALLPLVSRAPLVYASELGKTDLFRALVEAMRRDPASCVRAHNEAAIAHPTTGIRPLMADEVQDRFELPLWHLAPGGPRRRVYAESLGSVPPDQLAPRAVLLTGILRIGACDLFIHGTGGGGGGESGQGTPPAMHRGWGPREGYDRVTEEWLERWGRADPDVGAIVSVGLAPATVVTATRFLPLTGDPLPSGAEVARARWMVHRALHDPTLLRDVGAARQKQELVRAIAAAPRHSRERAALFHRMHDALDRARHDHSADLDALRDRADAAEASRNDAALAYDRTWPFPLFPESSMRELRDEIGAAFTGADR